MAYRAKRPLAPILGLAPTLLAIVVGLYLAREVLIPVAVAILLAFLLTPLVGLLERWRLGRILPVLLTVGLALIVVGGAVWTVEQQFVDVAEKLPYYRDTIRAKWTRLQSAAGSHFSKAAIGVKETLQSVADTQPATQPTTTSAAARVSPPHPGDNPIASTLGPASPSNPLPVREYSAPQTSQQIAAQLLGRLMGPLATSGLVLVLVLFALLYRKGLRDRAIQLAGRGRLYVTTHALDDAATRISHYLLIQSAINLGYGITIGLGLWTISAVFGEGPFPSVLLWALIAGLFRFIPYIGPVLGAALPLAISVAIFNNIGVFIATFAMYLIVELIIANVLEPLLYGSSTGLSPPAVLLSAIFWAWLWGPAGLLLSTPMTVCVAVLGKYIPKLQFFNILLGDEPALDPAARLYQRLLALDRNEASLITEAWRKERGLRAVYDDLLIPALVMMGADQRRGRIDPDTVHPILLLARSLIEQLGAAHAKDDQSAPAKQNNRPDAELTDACESRLTILCLPARDEADEVAALMLKQVLEFAGRRAIVASPFSLAGEMLELVRNHDAALVCISALPPSAMAHCRYLCKRLASQHPDLPVVVGVWTSRTQPVRILDRLACHGHALRAAATLAGAMEELYQSAQPLLLRGLESTAR